MAKTPKKEAARIIFGNKEKKQFPDPEGLEREKPTSAIEGATQPLGFGTRLRDKFSEQVSEIGIESRHREDMAKKGMRQTFASRSNKRPKHLQHPAPVRGGPYKQTPQMEKPHYEEVENMTDKTFKDFVTEAKRGRPRKLRPGEQADTEHIQDQLAKLTHPNHVVVHFKDGSKHQIPREHANKALQHLASLKPIHRADHAEHMGKGHAEFYHVLTRKSIPDKKSKITLAGPKLRKEEVDLDEAKDNDKPERSEHSWPTRRNKQGGWSWANSISGGHASAEAADRHYVNSMNKLKNTKVHIDDIKPGDKPLGKPVGLGGRSRGLPKWAKSSVKEEVEQIDETSQAKKDKYVERSSSQASLANFTKRHAAGKTKTDAENIERKRKIGLNLALKREETELDETKAIKGTHATKAHAAPSISPSKIKFKGKGTIPKAQNIKTEDYAPLEKGETQTHPDQKTANAKSRVQGADKPVKPKKMALTKEEWALYEMLSDANKIIFEKMEDKKRAELVDKYFKNGGKITHGEYNKPREAEKPFPASKMKGSKWASTAGSISRKNQGYKK